MEGKKVFVLVTWNANPNESDGGLLGVFSTREKAMKAAEAEDYPEEFSDPEKGFWSTEYEACQLIETEVQ